jgi:ABC-type Fe3+/spermidine/putrescine transport system ATPase subunit
MMGLIAENISKSFNHTTVLHDINLHIRKREIHALVGPSGTGKTTLLKIIAGMEKPDSGRIFLHRNEITNLAVNRRNIGYVFQEYALFPHLTVFDNIAYGLKAARIPKKEINRKVDTMLNLTDLFKLQKELPSNLSGGQRQRLALARTLVMEPEIILLDEPFAHCDTLMRSRMARKMRTILEAAQTSALLVTHNYEDASELADTVSVLTGGTIVEEGSISKISKQPQTEFTGALTGGHTTFSVKIARCDNDTCIAFFPQGNVQHKLVLKTYPYYTENEECHVAIRASETEITDATTGENCFTGKILKVRQTSAGITATVDLFGMEVIAHSSKEHMVDDTVSVYFPPNGFYPLCGQKSRRKIQERMCRNN